MKIVYRISLFLALLAGIWGCRVIYKMFFDVILEAKDVQNFKVEELPGTRPVLRISGLAFNSSMGVRKITATSSRATITVLVHLSLADRSKSGNFSYDLNVPDSVARVRFGRNPAPIWERKGP
jgi:hypothetical protein